MKQFDKNEYIDDIRFSLESVAELYEVSIGTVEDWVDIGELQSRRCGPDGKPVFGIEEVIDLILELEERNLETNRQ